MRPVPLQSSHRPRRHPFYFKTSDLLHAIDPRECIAGLYQPTHAQVLLNDDVVDCSHDESYLHGIRGTCEVGIDLFRRMLVQPEAR